MKLPNKYGTVVKLSGNRRNPFVAKKTTGWNDKGHPVVLIVGYYPTKEAGLMALAEYNNEPWNVNRDKISFKELFELWEEKKAAKLGTSNRSSLKSGFKHCSRLFDVNYKELRAHQMQACIDGCGCGYSTQGAIKNLFTHLDRFALELDLIMRCYSGLLVCESIPESNKTPFTEDEITRLWGISDMAWVDSVLVFLYSGFRISELLDILVVNVDLNNWTIKGGTKTKSGKDRIVPIHAKIRPLITKRLADGGDYLFMHNGQKISTGKYYMFWHQIMNHLEIAHTVHETRHTFRSRLDSAGANKRCIDLLMGHKSKDVGERVYTHKTLQELRETVGLLE